MASTEAILWIIALLGASLIGIALVIHDLSRRINKLFATVTKLKCQNKDYQEAHSYDLRRFMLALKTIDEHPLYKIIDDNESMESKQEHLKQL